MLTESLTLNRLWFELIETQAKIAFYDGRGWNPRKLYLRIEELETEIQQLTATIFNARQPTNVTQPRDALGRFRSVRK